jgi:hypothetical protein
VLTTMPTRDMPSPPVVISDRLRSGVHRKRSPWSLLRRAAGLDEELLTYFPGDRSFYTRIIVSTLLVSVMAGTSLTMALTMTTDSDPWGWPIVFGAGLGVLIAAVDLSIALPDGQRRRKRSWSYIARMAFAVVAGVLLSMPLTAVLFAPEVDRREAQAQDAAAETAAVRYDEQVAAARSTAHAQHVEAVQAATAARDTARDAAASAATASSTQRSACNAEIDGVGGSGIAGEGPRASAKCSAAAQLSDQAAAAQGRLNSAETALSDAIQADVAAQDAAAAKVQRPLVAPFSPADLGVVDRIARTHEALGTPGTLVVSAFLVFLDLLPLTLKVSGGRRPYEQVIEHRHDLALRELCQSLGGGADLTKDPDEEPTAPDAVNEDPVTLVEWLGRQLAGDPRLTAADLARRAPDAGYAAGYSTITRLIREHALRPTTLGARR